ncbi:MAG: SAVED domain-containing protein, partial [Anaerolineaceae bacterium]
ARKLIVYQKLNFDRESLLKLFKDEGLFREEPLVRTVRTMGIRSFTRFAENLEAETDSCISVDDKFENRFPKDGESWNTIGAMIKDYSNSQINQLGTCENKLILDCHSSFSFLAGYVFTHRSHIFPAGPRPFQEMIKPQRDYSVTSDSFWKTSLISLTDDEIDLAVAVSVSNQIDKQVIDYLNNNQTNIGKLLILENASGTGATSVKDAEHAWSLASTLIQEVRKYQISGHQTMLFISAPNFLTFFIGQLSHPLGNLTLFEYDFDNQYHGTYFPSFSIPLSNVSD